MKPDNKVKPTIIILLPRGETIRNFVYTGLIDKIREKYDLVLYSVIPNDSIKTLLSKKCDVLYEISSVPKLGYVSKLLIEQTDFAHNRHLWSGASKMRWALREAEANGSRVFQNDKGEIKGKNKFSGGLKIILKLKIKKLVGFIFANKLSLQILDQLLNVAAKYEDEVRRYAIELQKHNPVLVFNSSHVHALNTYSIIQAARRSNITTTAFLFSWDNLTSQGRIFPQHDFYLSWNTKIKNQLHEIYPRISLENVYVTGTPQFIFHFNPQFHSERNEFLKYLGLNENDKYVLYSVGLSHNIPFEDVVAERIADMLPRIAKGLKLVIRTYGKDKTTIFKKLAERRTDIAVPEVTWISNHNTPTLNDQKIFTNLLRHCELGINVGSTVSLELAMFDKPVIYVGYDPPGMNIFPISYAKILDFDHLRPIVDSGAIAYAHSEDEMYDSISTYLNEPSIHKSERRKLINDFFEVSDSEKSKLVSTVLIEQAIDSIVSKRKENFYR